MKRAIGQLSQDVAYGARFLRRSPGFTAVVVLTLALGIGVNSAIFSLVYAALLRPIPFRDVDRLAFISTGKVQAGVYDSGVSGVEFEDWKPQLPRIFSEYATVGGNAEATWTAGGAAAHLRNRPVSANFFRLLGVNPAAGRFFTGEETQAGHGDVAILSHETWLKYFSGDPRAIGQTMRRNGGAYASYTVIGILPRGFEFDEATDVWTPQQPLEPSIQSMRAVRRHRVLGRLADGVTISQAQAAMSTLAAQQSRAYPASNQGWGTRVALLRERLQSGRHPGLLLLWAAVGCLLWIACANTANLLLSRADGRRREIGVRLALGSSRGRLMALLLTESGLLALAGCALGWAASASALRLLETWGTYVLPVAALQDVARLHASAIDPAILGFTLAVSLLSVAMFGVVPARRAASLDLSNAIRSSSRRAAGSIGTSQVLITAEVAVVMVLTISAGLLIRSLLKLTAVDPGIRTANRLMFDIELPRLPDRPAGSPPITRAESMQRFHRHAEWFEELERRLQAISGVRSAGASSAFPFADEGGGWGVKVGDLQLPEETSMAFVTPGYFDTMEAPILEGSNFTPAHYANTVSKPLVVNQTLARLLFPDGSAVGKHVRAPRCGIVISSEVRLSDCVIVGIAGDTRFSLDQAAPPAFYYALRQDVGDRLTFAVRTSSDPAPLIPAVRAAVASMPAINGGSAYLFRLQTVDQLKAQSVAAPRFRSWLITLFTGMALVLAAVGMYGVQAYAVSGQTREIGIRMALGAGPAEVFAMILRRAAAWTMLGAAIGIAGGIAAARLITGLLFGVGRLDPVTLIASPLILLAAALLASYVPARRAMRVDLIVALRWE